MCKYTLNTQPTSLQRLMKCLTDMITEVYLSFLILHFTVVNCTLQSIDARQTSMPVDLALYSGPGPGTYARLVGVKLTDPDPSLAPEIRRSGNLTDGSFRYLTKLSFQCLSGYTHPQSSTSRVCQATGLYSGISHNCTSKICGALALASQTSCAQYCSRFVTYCYC